MNLILLMACAADEPLQTVPVEIPEDNVASALGDCLGAYRTPPEYPNQLASGDELQRYTLRDPQAVCNDGSPAVMYVRGYTNPALADTWSVHLQGGGGCGSYASCAIRWCGLDYYDSSKMSSQGLPSSIAGFGIFDEDPLNLLAGANQVYFYYCSSDAWRGEGSAEYSPDGLEIPGELPVELPDELPEYSLFRRGHTILESGLDELAQGLVAEGGEELPPLDQASLVVFNGTSGGSVGARANADYVRERLSGAGTEVVAVFDAAFIPLSEQLPEPYASALDAHKEAGWLQSLETDDSLPFMDQSCWEHLGGTEDQALCYDADYLALNHITTPFFLRQDLRDVGGAAETVAIPEDVFQEATIRLLEAFGDIQRTAVEGSDIAVMPGVYGPNCAQHVALESTSWWAVGSVQDEAGADWTFQQAVLAWYEGAAVSVVDEPNGGSGSGSGSTCPGVEDER